MRAIPMKAILLAGLLFVPAAYADPEVEKVLKRDFHARGQATMDRVVQDGVQALCTASRDNPPETIAKVLLADQMKTIAFPTGSLIGDWKRGERIAQNGRGSMWSDKPGGGGGGSCYNCHQLSPQEASHGTLGPSLLGFGKKRGNGPEIQRYAYGKIYNAKAYVLCSPMPRLGHAGTLTPEQIKDVVGLLLDPASPVNK
jgi:L-cysteine S-thiosulfotransferase